MQVSVILLAAGLGQRMGAAVNKIWLPLAGKPLLQYSLEFFARSPQVSQIIAVAHAGELEPVLCLARRIGRPFWLPPPGRIIWGRFWRPQ